MTEQQKPTTPENPTRIKRSARKETAPACISASSLLTIIAVCLALLLSITAIILHLTDRQEPVVLPSSEPVVCEASVPDYVIEEANAVARKVHLHQSSNSIVFPFLSDAHSGYFTDTSNTAITLAGQLLDQIGQRVPFDFIVNDGDIADGAWSTTREMTYQQIEDYTRLISAAHKGVPSIWTVGNHDDAPYRATKDRLSQEETFVLFGRKNRLSGAVCPDGCNYGYLDLDNRYLRIIYLDTDDKRSWGTVDVGSGETAPAYLNAQNVGGEQLQWLASTALDFSDKDQPSQWSVIIMSHAGLNISGTITDAVSGKTYAHSTTHAATILNAYMAGESGSIEHNGVSVRYDFSRLHSRADVICSVHGHNHRISSEMLGNLLSIGCPNLMNGRERVSEDGVTYAKTPGTADGTAFSILTIDRANHMIYVDCVGAGYDRQYEYTPSGVAPSYTNMLPRAQDEAGSLYNGCGWKEDTYLSSGEEGVRKDIFTSGYLPVTAGDTLYFQNVGMYAGEDNHRLSLYDTNMQHIATIKTSAEDYVNFGFDERGIISSIRITQAQGDPPVCYVRICCGELSKDSIITVNEPIE